MKRKAKEKSQRWFEVCSAKIKRIEGLPHGASAVSLSRVEDWAACGKVGLEDTRNANLRGERQSFTCRSGGETGVCRFGIFLFRGGRPQASFSPGPRAREPKTRGGRPAAAWANWLPARRPGWSQPEPGWPRCQGQGGWWWWCPAGPLPSSATHHHPPPSTPCL